MIRMTYECPETHAPLPHVSTAVWTATAEMPLLVVRCPHCSKRHVFSRADAILSIDAPSATGASIRERDGSVDGRLTSVI